MKQIPLTQGKFALVDDEDYNYLMQFTWFLQKTHTSDLFYAGTNINIRGISERVMMHTMIMGFPPIVDHLNGNGLDNTRKNLRPATAQFNSYNRGANKNNTSGFKGVHFCKGAVDKPWQARIGFRGARHSLGYYATAEEAHEAYKAAANKLHGEFAKW